MRTMKSLVTLAVLTASVGGVGAGLAPSAAATTEAEGPKRCVVVLDKYDAGTRTSPILAQKCTTDEKELTDLRAQAGLLLLRAYDDIGYGGVYAEYYGQYGPCDSEGYGIPHPGYMLGRISSFTVHGSCNYTTAYTGGWFVGDQETYRSNAWYVSDYMNDRIASFRVRYAG